MPPRNALPGIVAFLLVAAASTGCSQRIEPPKGAPVSGSVLLKGKPAAGVRVTFHPQFDMGKTKWLVSGTTDRNGAFSAGTGFGGTMEAPIGDYVITFEKPRTDTDKDGLEIEVDDFKGKYSDPSTSLCKATVKKEGDNKLEPFQLD